MSKHDEFIDEELQAIGVKFTDETAPKEMPELEHREGPGGEKKVASKRGEAVDAKYVPVPKGGTEDPSPTWCGENPTIQHSAFSIQHSAGASPAERLNKCVRGVGPLAVISGVLIWWQQAGLLDPKAAWPSFVVIALLAGLVIGRYALRGGNT